MRRCALFLLLSSGAACVRQEALDASQLPNMASAILVYDQIEHPMLEGINGGPENFPARTVHPGLRIRAVFWAKSLIELEVPEGLFSGTTTAAEKRKLPELSDERIFETNLNATGATDWAETDDKTVHDFELAIPADENCARTTDREGCREEEGAGKTLYCLEDCGLKDLAVVQPADPNIDAPQPFERRACPSGQWPDGPWTEATKRIRDQTFHRCVPPQRIARLSCPIGQTQLPGATSCAPIGTACGAGDYTTRVLPAGTVYVRPNGTGGGGAPNDPLGTIAAAIAVAPAGGTIALAKGTYREEMVASKAVHIIGACVEQTLIAPALGGAVMSAGGAIDDMALEGSPALIAEGGGFELVLHGVALSGGAASAALLVQNGARVTGEVVVFSGLGRPIEVAAGALELDGVVAASSGLADVHGPTSTATISHVIADGFPRGAGAIAVADGAQLVLESATIAGFERAGIEVSGVGSTAIFREVAFRGTENLIAVPERNRGAVVSSGAELHADVWLVEYAQGGGLLIDGASAVVRDGLFRENGTHSEAGAAVTGSGHATFERVAFEANRGPSVLICGAALSDCGAEDFVCPGQATRCSDVFLREVSIFGRSTATREPERDFGVIVGRSAELEAHRLVIAENLNGAIRIERSGIATISDAMILEHLGLDVDYGIGLPEDGELVLSRSAIVGTDGAAAMVLEGLSRATLSHVTFAESGGGIATDECEHPGVSVGTGSEFLGDHLGLIAGGVRVQDRLEGGQFSTARISDVIAGAGTPVCVLRGAAAFVDRLSATASAPLRLNQGSLKVNDLTMANVARAIEVQPEGSLELSRAAIAIEVSREDQLAPAIVIGGTATAAIDNLHLAPSVLGDPDDHPGEPAVQAIGGSLVMDHFEIVQALTAIEAGPGALTLKEGAIKGYVTGLKLKKNPTRTRHDFFTRMVYRDGPIEAAVIDVP